MSKTKQCLGVICEALTILDALPIDPNYENYQEATEARDIAIQDIQRVLPYLLSTFAIEHFSKMVCETHTKGPFF